MSLVFLSPTVRVVCGSAKLLRILRSGCDGLPLIFEVMLGKDWYCKKGCGIWESTYNAAPTCPPHHPAKASFISLRAPVRLAALTCTFRN